MRISLRPACLAAHVGIVPLAALAIGAVLPGLGEAMRPGVGGIVALLSFASVACIKPTPPTRRDIGAALLMVAMTLVTCLLTLTGIVAAGLPPDLAVVTALVAASPIAFGTPARFRQCGLPERPAVWAAVGGMTLTPLVLPLAAVVALTGVPAAPADTAFPMVLAERTLLFSALPAALAYVLRCVAPRWIAAGEADLRGLGVLALAGVGLGAGASLAHAIGGLGWVESGVPFMLAMTVQGVAFILALTVAICVGRRTNPLLGCSLVLAAASRNSTFAWAAVGAMSPRAEAVLALTLAATFILPPLVRAGTKGWRASAQ